MLHVALCSCNMADMKIPCSAVSRHPSQPDHGQSSLFQKKNGPLKTMAQFFDLVKEADIEGDEETSDILFELTNYEIDGSVRGTLYKVLSKLYSKKNHVELRLDCRDLDGSVWVTAFEWDPERRKYARKATLWTTLNVCLNAGVIEMVESEDSDVGFKPSIPARVDWVKAWSLEESYEEHDVSDDEDRVMVHKRRWA